MRKIATVLCVLVMCIVIPGLAGAALTFDDLTGDQTSIPNGYGGLNWSSSFYYLNGVNYSGNPSGYANGVISPNNVAFNAYESDVSITGTSFNFNGAYFTAAWNDGLKIDITGKLNGNVVHSGTWILQTSVPTWIGVNWTGIDELYFHSYEGTAHGYGGGGTHFVMDNFNGTAPVPIPGALLLFAPGLAGLAAIRRRFTK